MGKYIRTLSITYDLVIANWEVTMFRGAVVDAIGSSVDGLFHNHCGADGFRYAYPLIQYKRQGGKACIVAVGQGVDIIGQFMASAGDHVRIGDREVCCKVIKMRPCRVLVQLWQQSFHYRLRRWLPLNEKNYRLYQLAQNVEERKTILESVLKGNLLAMLKGVDVWLDGHLVVNLIEFSDAYPLRYKGVNLLAFDAVFSSNLSIPANIGLGKHVSVGFGTIHRMPKVADDNSESEAFIITDNNSQSI